MDVNETNKVDVMNPGENYKYSQCQMKWSNLVAGCCNIDSYRRHEIPEVAFFIYGEKKGRRPFAIEAYK
jgi:hypothetical protein